MIDCIFDTTKDKIGKLTQAHISLLLIINYSKNQNINTFSYLPGITKEILKKEKKKKIKWFTHLN